MNICIYIYIYNVLYIYIYIYIYTNHKRTYTHAYIRRYRMLRNGNGHFELVTKKKTDGTMSLKVKLVKQLNYEKRHKYQLEVSITKDYDTMCHM